MASIPETSHYFMVTNYSSDFRKATEIRELPIPDLSPTEVLVKMKYAGVNAAEVNFTRGRYYFDSKPLPHILGVDGLGEIVKVGSDSKFKIGDLVAILTFETFGDYVKADCSDVCTVPSLDPAYLSIVASGTTASVGLEVEAGIKKGEVVLITGAAGGAGHMAVLLAKLAGCTVVGTCSSPEKVEFLKSIGCDRPVNYTTENLDDVLKKEFPKGVDVVFETVGGKMIEVALGNIADFGRIVVIGQVSVYEEAGDPFGGEVTKPESKIPIALTLLLKNASIRGLNVILHGATKSEHNAKLNKMYQEGQLKPRYDTGEGDPKGPFKGLASVPDAMDYMYARKNKGKVIIEL